MRRALQFLALAALVAVLVIGLTQAGGDDEGKTSTAPSAAESKKALEGAPPPLAELYAEGNMIVPSGPSDFKARLAKLHGYPVVVNVWGSWCGPCKLEFPYFAEASTQLGKKVGFIGVNLFDNREAAESFLAKRPIPYPSLEDGNGQIAQLVAPGARGAPITIYYDAQGKSQFIHQGQYKSTEKLVADIERYTDA